VLLGANNAGKSTIVEALALLFGREKMVRPISDWDFYGGSPKPESRFHIVATVTGFPENDPVAVPDWFIGENAARPVWWHEENSTLSNETDAPSGALLAAQVALAGRYDDEACEFDTVRYFYYGESDPFTDGCAQIPVRVLRDLGLFLLSSNREWDKLLSFSSSSLLKVIREYDALPGKAIEELKILLRNDVTRIEEVSPLSTILESAANELQSFLLIGGSSKLVYRPTSLDAISVLQSLVAHVRKDDGSLLPVARHGAGMISLQAFLLLLAFAEQRRSTGRNFILAAEEPELHLHPSLHQRLVNRIRSASLQSIITTQSPHVASAYQPSEVLFLRNTGGVVTATPLRTEPIKDITSNSIKNLYLVRRRLFYEALMGGIVLVPEGLYDFEWLNLWQQLAQASPETAADYDVRPIALIPTSDAAILETFQEVSKFRPDAIPIIDGDSAGDDHCSRLSTVAPIPRQVVRFGDGAGVECLAAWMLAPALSTPTRTMAALLGGPDNNTLKGLQDALIGRKKDREIHETLTWESLEIKECCKRACEFFHDITAIASDGKLKNKGWKRETDEKGSVIFTATHVQRARL
jgi:hypothetical protein